MSVVAKTSLSGNYHAFSQPAWDVIGYPVEIESNSPTWPASLRDMNFEFVAPSLFPKFLTEPTIADLTIDKYFSLLQGHFSPDPSVTNTWQLYQPSALERTDQSPVWLPKNKLLRQAINLSTRTRTRVPELTPSSSRLLASSDIHITFGNVRPRLEPRNNSPISVVLEHGQIRWLADGPEHQRYERSSFQRLCEKSEHIWVTNLDQRTLDIARELFPNKWGVLPHPYVLDPSCPYQEIDGVRSQLIAELNTDFLVLNASSLSIGGEQRKGVDKLLQALNALRKDQGIRIGIVLVRWGTDIEKVVQLIHSLGLDDQCRFIDPLPRVALQRFMSSFDVVSDQFDYDAFGGLTIRALEQGMPLLSRPIGESAAALIGGRPPIVEASSIDEILTQLNRLYSDVQEIGRDNFLLKYRGESRQWIVDHHHHHITRALQEETYTKLMEDGLRPSVPGRWGELVETMDVR